MTRRASLPLPRRAFMTLCGGMAAWPLSARGQHRPAVRRIGVLMNVTPDDPASALRLSALAQGLQQSGWTIGGNVRVDFRSAGGDAHKAGRLASELIALAPDVILSAGSTNLRALQEATRDVPIVFVAVTDPVGAGFVASLAHPGANRMRVHCWRAGYDTFCSGHCIGRPAWHGVCRDFLP
jgi:putative tryptophan/tyrosine transport system substrate-binding protein